MENVPMRMRVMGNGQLYNLKKIYKMVKKFERMNWIEQQSFFMGAEKYIKQPPNEHWTKTHELSVKINEDF